MHWTESFILAVNPDFLTAQAYAYEGSDRDPVSDADRQGSEAHRTEVVDCENLKQNSFNSNPQKSVAGHSVAGARATILRRLIRFSLSAWKAERH